MLKYYCYICKVTSQVKEKTVVKCYKCHRPMCLITGNKAKNHVCRFYKIFSEFWRREGR